MPKPCKKERRRIKQKLKQKQSIKLRNESPYKRLAAAGRVESCKVNDNCRDQGLYCIYARLAVPNRPPTLACFLVDKWCMGLKDAWGRLDMTHDMYHDFMESVEYGAEFKLIDMDADEARRLITAGIRQAHVMGFRLPPDYGKWVKTMGVGDDWASADIGDFGKDGKYFFVGPLDHLAERLIDGDAEKFLARPDVEYIAGLPGDFGPADYDDDDEMDDDADVEQGEEDDGFNPEGVLRSTSERLVDMIVKWCVGRGEQPHPDLMDAATLTLCASAVHKCNSDPASPSAPSLEFILSVAPPEDRQRLREPVLQIGRAVLSFPDGDAFVDAAGFVLDDEEEGDGRDSVPQS